ncbi:MAG: sensor histidine kinase, partial [Ktedonobacterales bacterium]
SGARTPADYQRALEAIQAENDYMSQLVENLLAVARADAGQAPLRAELVDLGDIALEAVERLAPLARERGVALTAGELPEVYVRGDRAYLARMLANLVENAVKYTAGTGSHVGVAAGAAQRGTTPGAARDEWAFVRVSDDGPGIAPEHLPHLFERFYRVDAARTRDVIPSDDAGEIGETGTGDEAFVGSGLGLAIAQWVAQAHSGEIVAESVAGSGSAFTVWLPLDGR